MDIRYLSLCGKDDPQYNFRPFHNKYHLYIYIPLCNTFQLGHTTLVGNGIECLCNVDRFYKSSHGFYILEQGIYQLYIPHFSHIHYQTYICQHNHANHFFHNTDQTSNLDQNYISDGDIPYKSKESR